MIARSVCVLAIALASCRGGKSPTTQTTPVTPVTQPPVPVKIPLDVLDDVAMIARGNHLTAAERDALADADELKTKAFVDALVREPAVARQAALVFVPLPVSYEPPWIEPVGVLKTFTTKRGKQIFYSGKPCKEKDAVEVTPWWNMAGKINVCRNNHRPEHVRIPWPGVFDICRPDGDIGALCGCGPNMVLCTPDEATRAALKTSLRTELTDTVAHLIQSGARLEQLFLSNATFRNAKANLWYVRDNLLAGRPATEAVREMADWPAEGKWAPRPESVPGHHAGLLTTGQLTFLFQGARQRMQVFQEIMWCVEARSIKVTTDQIFSLGTADFRNEHAEGLKLANLPVCDSCHARMDHALPFFAATEDTGYYFAEKSPKRPAAVYVADRQDRRGEAAAVPHEFARLATSVPEFGQCMTRRVTEHVFADQATRADYEAVQSAFEATGEYRTMLTAALLRLIERRVKPARAAAKPTTNLRGLLAEHCTDCHDSDHEVNLTTDTLSRETLRKALEEVSLERMPKGFPPLGWDARRELIDAMVAEWPVAAERPSLTQFYSKAQHNLSAPRPQALQQVIHDRTSFHGSAVPVVPEPYNHASRADLEFTPDLVLFTTMEAVNACKQSGQTNVEQCSKAAVRGLIK